MKSLEDDFIKGYLDIPELDNCSPAPQPSTQKTSKKRVALADVDTNVPETTAEAEPKQKKRRSKKSKDSCLSVPPEATGVILDIAEFDFETQATTVQDEMCKDVKLLVRTVLKMGKAMTELHTKVEDVSKEVNQLLQIQNCKSRMQMLPSPPSPSQPNGQMPCPPLPSSQPNDQMPPLPRLFSQLIEQMPAPDLAMSSSQPNEQMPASDPPMPSSQLNEQMPSLPSSQLIVQGSPLLLPTTLYDVQAPLGATPPSTLSDEIQQPLLQDHYQPSQRFSGPDLEMLSPPFNFQHPPLTPASNSTLDIPTPRVISASNAKFGELPSSEINKASLKPISDVLQKYSNLRVECTIGKLAVKLAREAIFGDSIMKRCTPRGWNDLPALPQVELNLLKATLFRQFPRFWVCPEEFERKWTTAQEALAQACKRLRRM